MNNRNVHCLFLVVLLELSYHDFHLHNKETIISHTLKKVLRVISTNWIHLVGFYVTTYLTLIFFKAIGLSEDSDTWLSAFTMTPFTILVLFLIYGLAIIGGFYTALIVLDIVSFQFAKLKVVRVLFLEWLFIVPPFVYWAFEYKYWLWLTLSFSFLITQFIRKPKIERFLEIGNEATSAVS